MRVPTTTRHATGPDAPPLVGPLALREGAVQQRHLRRPGHGRRRSSRGTARATSGTRTSAARPAARRFAMAAGIDRALARLAGVPSSSSVACSRPATQPRDALDDLLLFVGQRSVVGQRPAQRLGTPSQGPPLDAHGREARPARDGRGPAAGQSREPDPGARVASGSVASRRSSSRACWRGPRPRVAGALLLVASSRATSTPAGVSSARRSKRSRLWGATMFHSAVTAPPPSSAGGPRARPVRACPGRASARTTSAGGAR